MKVKKSSSDDIKEKMSLSGSSVFNRLGARPDNKLDRNSRVGKRESPRKVIVGDLPACSIVQLFSV